MWPSSPMQGISYKSKQSINPKCPVTRLQDNRCKNGFRECDTRFAGLYLASAGVVMSVCTPMAMGIPPQRMLPSSSATAALKLKSRPKPPYSAQDKTHLTLQRILCIHEYHYFSHLNLRKTNVDPYCKAQRGRKNGLQILSSVTSIYPLSLKSPRSHMHAQYTPVYIHNIVICWHWSMHSD